MDIQQYLQNQMRESAHYSLTDQDQKILNAHGIEEFIYRKLMSKKFRKWSIPESVQEKIRAVIHNCIEDNKPIVLSLSYGGFKLWRMPTTPEVDWSEFFYITYHLKYMAPIAAAYKPGVVFDFSSGDIAVTVANNVPRADVDQYDMSMRTLIEAFTLYLPENIQLTASRLRDLFKDEEEFIAEAENQRVGARDRFAADQEYADEFKKGAIQNVQLEGGQKDLSGASDAEIDEMRIYAAEVVESLYNHPQVAVLDEKCEIALMATNIAIDMPMITTGTTKRSSAKFWAGMGVIAKDGDDYAEYVITPRQWAALKDEPHEVVDIDLIPLINFKQIRVYPERLSFGA